jgi:hypothetical protein
MNRRTLARVECWIDEQTYSNSVFNYGLPPQVRRLIDKEIGNELTYSDALVYLCTSLPQPIRYLELGVSVGKNFTQVLYALKNSELTGFDIEEINPTLVQLLEQIDKITWKSPSQSLRRAASSLNEYHFTKNNNKVTYVCADIWDERAWSHLAGRQFNVIFSDALHSPDALLHEHAMLRKFNLLSDNFVMLWDDLDGGMREAFEEIARRLKRDENGRRQESYIVNLRGWLGVSEGKHAVGIFRRY